jgi:PGDYG protein
VDLRLDHAAHRARKRPDALTVEFAQEGGTLATREGPVKYASGDALMTGSAGERWPVPRAEFDASYEPFAPLRPGKPGRYRKRSLVVWAKQMRARFAVSLSGGRGELTGEAGDWLVQYAPDDWGVVGGALFAQTYELLD